MICADFLCSLEENPLCATIDQQPEYIQKAIVSNNELWKENKEVIKEWLVKAEKCKAFYGRNRKLEWHINKGTDIWDSVITFRASGIRIATTKYCPTLVTNSSRPIIGQRKRYLTPRECARLQSFPDTFKMHESSAQAYKQFGNSVNIECVKLFAKFLLGDEETRRKYSK